ncbi:extracellular solute-binding protein [Paenibacillus sp. MMS18-CY102]|uniref:extracellular solute-binding protein n=1 Tax=Paenibacillus sp. MMS18-CY102 TaxID=2682849 RepID=UPI001365796C|nr:extracellular solute-binding protein [Paenibacillus sp. MMS18-CY102]MWC27878.1 extracellular solute-binding protein [Paenibacillus sp. MMS18-CY102]
MRKWLAVLVALVVVIAGCSSNGGDKGGKEAEPAKSGDTATADKPVTINFHSWHILENENLKGTIEQFEKTHPGIKINYVPLVDNGDATESIKKLDLLVSSDENLDIVVFPDTPKYNQHAAMGILAPMDGLLKEQSISVKDDYKIDPSFNGHVYALPGKYVEYMVLLNKNHLDEAGLPVPTDWTWDDFMAYAKKLTKGEGATKRYGAYFHTWPVFFQQAVVNQPTDNGFLKADGSSNMDNPGFAKSLQILNQTMNVDKSAYSYADVTSQKMHYRNVYSGQTASMIPIGNWMIVEAGGNDKFAYDHTTVFAPYPKNSKDDPSGYTSASADYYGIAANSKHKKEAFTFLRWLTTEGIVYQGSQFPSWTKADMNQVVENMLKFAKRPELIDKTSLMYVLNHSKAGVPNVPSYQSELENAFIKESEKYLLGAQDLDTTMKSAKETIQGIIDANKP